MNAIQDLATEITKSVNSALAAKLPAPNVIMVLEMIKLEIASEHIAHQAMLRNLQHAKEMAAQTPEQSKIITGN